MKIKRIKYALIPLLIGLAIIGYFQRAAIRDLIDVLQKLRLPKEIRLDLKSTSDAAGGTTVIKRTSTENQPYYSNTKNKQIVKAFAEEINLAVPFTSQAPFAEWDEIHEETCEEASELMADAYFNNKKFTPKSAESELLKLNDWEAANIGEYMNTSTEQAAQVLVKYFHFADVSIRKITSQEYFLDTIIEALNNDKLIIMPAAGQLLGNPNFTAPGPIYHMLVIKGYTKNNDIITNDPGTRRGHNYVYTLETLYNALHYWNQGDVIHGEKILIIVGG